MPEPEKQRRPGERADERLPSRDRIRKRSDFLRVQRSGRRVHTPHFVVVCLASQHQRLGITVTKRVARAVGRNRIKRLVREVFRRNRHLFPVDAEVVVVARAGADQLDYAAVRGELAQAAPALARAVLATGTEPRGRRS